MAACDEGDTTQSSLAGFIFMCNKHTMKECFQHGIFGLPFNSLNLVSQVVPGTILFLFEYEARKMRGIYKATSYGAFNINKNAYSKGSFPAQVRFEEIERCPPLGEDEFKDTIRENYYSNMKFQFELSYDQVYRLCTAFLWKVASMSEQGVKVEGNLDHSTSPGKQLAEAVEPSNGRSKQLSGCKSVQFDEHEEDQSLYADRVKYKPSVWARLSGCNTSDKAQAEVVTEKILEEVASVSDAIGSEECTRVPDEKGLGEGCFSHIYYNGGGEEMCSSSCLHHDLETLGGAQHDQERLEDTELFDRCIANFEISNLESGFFVDFKRRNVRLNKDTQEAGSMRAKKRRRLIRPVFSEDSPSIHEQGRGGQEFDSGLRLGQNKQGSAKIAEEGHEGKGFFDLFCKSNSTRLGIQKVVPLREIDKELFGGFLSLKTGPSQPAIVKVGRNENRNSNHETSEICSARGKEPITWAPQSEDSNGVIHNFSVLLDVDRSVVRLHNVVDARRFGEKTLDLNQPLCRIGSHFSEMSGSALNADSTAPIEPGLDLELQIFL